MGWRTLRVLVLAVAALSIAAHSVTAIVVKVSEDELLKKASGIVIGRVIDERSYWNEQRTLILTDYTIQMKEAIKGDAGTSISKVTIVGGRIGDVELVVSDSPTLHPGEEVLLYLAKCAEGRIGIVHGEQGKYTIVNGAILETGESVRSYVVRAKSRLGIAE